MPHDTAQRPIETLPADAYTGTAQWDLERERIFQPSWHLVGPVADLATAGSYRAISLVGRPVVIVRRRDGKLVGFHNVCRHRAGPLVDGTEGVLKADALTCQYHGWTYDLNGDLRSAAGAAAPCPGIRLFSVHLAEWNGLIFANISERPHSFDMWLGGIRDIAHQYARFTELEPLGSITLTGACNWKAYGDNSCEGWHVPFVHKTLKNSTSPDEVKITTHADGEYVLFDVVYRDNGADRTRTGQGHWIYKFPGLLLHFSEHTVNVETVIPVGPGEIRLERHFWGDRRRMQEMALGAEDIIGASEAVMREDLAISERVQENLECSPYQVGYLVSDKEPGTLYFQHLVRRYLSHEG